MPWGISESGYNAIDARLNYQYRAFGVPGLGLKRGLAEDLVIAPYATRAGADGRARGGLRRTCSGWPPTGVAGRYGFYEAIDYTPARAAARPDAAPIVRSFMAHHQGMSLLSLAHLLLDRPMQRRFEADPQFQATLLLLQERVPRTARVPPARGRSSPAARADRRRRGRQLRVFHDRRHRRARRCSCCPTAATT